MKITVKANIFNKAYLPSLLDYRKRYEVYYGGAGSGKSHFVAQKIVYRALQEERKILVLRKVGRTVKQSVFQMLIDTLRFFKIFNRCQVNKSDFTITLPNNSIFILTGLDDSEKIKSISGITDIWLEEATEFIQDDFNQLDLRLRHPTAKNQQMYLSFNPTSKASWCYRLFFMDNFEGEEERQEMLNFRRKVKILHTNYTNNRFLPQPYIDSLLSLKATNPVYYGIYALGNFGSLDKLIYTNWQKMDFDYSKIKGDLIVGLDFGYTNDPTALVASIVSKSENRIYIFKEWGGRGLLNDKIAKGIKDLGLIKSPIIADSAEPKSIDELKRHGVYRVRPSVKGQGSILQGIQRVQQYELCVHPDCKNMLEELQNYSWKKDKQTNEYINEAEDKWNHYLDALRYSLQGLEDRATLRSMDKNLLF